MRLRRFLFATAVLPFIGMVAFAYPEHPVTSPEITKADIAARDKALADDSFEGRGPGAVGGEAAAQWIADELKRIGVAPGNHGSYFQIVPTAVVTLDGAKSSLSIDTETGALPLKFPDHVVYWSPRYAKENVKLDKSQLVFVGYGVVAPEYGWDDYASVDVKGKTVVVLINDPGNEDASPDAKFFKGREMTYYGRWTYKFEEAARHGAAAVLIVHETKPAAYGFGVVQSSNSGPISWLLTADKNASQLAIRGWIDLETAQSLFTKAGLDYAALKAAANKPGFKAVELKGETMTVDAHSTTKYVSTRNVVGFLRGAKRPGEAVLFSAHWDHLGIKPDIAGPDKIYNGALDNAMGVSMVLDIAEAIAHGNRPDRTVAFLFPTLEEQGLMGAEYFAKHPLWQLANIAGDFNLDCDMPSAGTHDMVMPGNGQNTLDAYMIAALKAQGRTLSPDPTPEHGGYFRADHFAFAKVGVPSVTPGAGADFVVGGKEAAKAAAEDYVQNHYHKPTDEFNPAWDMTAPMQDAEAVYAAGLALANSTDWPTWGATSEFRAAREATLAKAHPTKAKK